MRQLTAISTDPKQKFTVVTEDNQSFELSLEYSDQQQCWFYSITFENIIINGARVATAPNILRSFQNVLPFGIAITTDDLSEPVFLDDFSTGRVKFYLLTSEEVQSVETDFYKTNGQ